MHRNDVHSAGSNLSTNTGRPRFGPLAAIVLLGTAAGCGTDSFDFAPANAGDAPRAREPGVSTHFVESFDNRLLVHSVTGGALLDANQGILTLPVEPFPRIDGFGVDEYQGDVEHNGLLEAEQIVVHASGNFEASDAVEMRAQDRIEISGNIRAGRGGVTLIGGRGVYVTGTIESRGPIRILVEDEDGEIEIAGHIAVHASADDVEQQAPHVELLGRGAVRITGSISSHADAGRPGGDIRVQVYGPVKVQGPRAQVVATADGDGAPGTIRLRSESSVTVAEGAQVGRSPASAGGDYDLGLGGNVELQGATVRIESDAHVVAGNGMLKGGSVFVTAGEALAIDGFSVVRSGHGTEGGSIIIKSQRIGIGEGASLIAGRGRSYGAHFTIEAVERLDVVGGATIAGGDTACGPGGDVHIAVGGSVRVREGATVRGGDGAIEVGLNNCSETAKGGDVRVQAHETDEHDAALVPGQGFPDGEVVTELDPTFEVAVPNLTVGTAGQVLSKIIDRGAAATGQVPRLRDASYGMPAGTTIALELCGAEDVAGPYETCRDLQTEDDLEALRDLQYFRYRVSLVGRVYDAPWLDYFELDLSPED